MQAIDLGAFRPEQSVEVPVPTIVGRLSQNATIQLCVQWFGTSDRLSSLTEDYGPEVAKIFNQAQFLFPIAVSVDHSMWMGHPECFEVISIGQAKDWMNPNTVSQFKDPEEWLLYISTTHYTVENPSGIGPAAFAIPLTVWIGDSLYGVIKPRKYVAYYEEAQETNLLLS